MHTIYMKTCWNSILLYIVYLDKRVANVLMLITLQYKSSIIYMCVRFYRWWHGDFRFIYDNIAERVQLTWTRILYLNISKLIIKQIFHICVYTRFRNKEKKKKEWEKKENKSWQHWDICCLSGLTENLTYFKYVPAI